jgi:Ser/Thr protein kinase RdoA (MazF antagonist)
VRVYCHNWRSKSEIQEELKLLRLLKDSNLNVSFPIPDKNENLIQSINAPEGLRYIVVFSFAEGQKMRFMSNDTCFAIGSLMAKIHTLTENKNIDRVNYNPNKLLNESYDQLSKVFSERLPEMTYLKKIGKEITRTLDGMSLLGFPCGTVHLDIWYDNLSVKEDNEITIFDFDNCGNGLLILDIGYFCKQLFFIESDKEEYESKVESFLNGYRSIKKISDTETKYIPEAGASIFVFYLGVQAQRFDWSNIFLTENYLKMFVGRIKSWLDYYKEKGKTVANRVDG